MYIKIITVRHGVDGQGEGEVFATARLRQHARLMVGKGLVQVAGGRGGLRRSGQTVPAASRDTIGVESTCQNRLIAWQGS